MYPLEERKGLVPLIPSGYLTLGSLVVKRYFEVYDGKRSQLGFFFSHEKRRRYFLSPGTRASVIRAVQTVTGYIFRVGHSRTIDNNPSGKIGRKKRSCKI